MGRCGDCRKQTQIFCFVCHEFVCPASLAEKAAHDRCVVGSYRKWVQDSSYKWPPECALCSQEIEVEQESVRLTCLHVLHAKCLVDAPPPALACPECGTPIVPLPTDTAPLAEKLRRQMARAEWFPSPISDSEESALRADRGSNDVVGEEAHAQNGQTDQELLKKSGRAAEEAADADTETESAEATQPGGGAPLHVESDVASRGTGHGQETVPTGGESFAVQIPVGGSKGAAVEGLDTVAAHESVTESAGGDSRSRRPAVGHASGAGAGTTSASAASVPVPQVYTGNPLDLEEGTIVDGAALGKGSGLSPRKGGGRRTRDDDDKALKYRKAVYKRIANELTRRWLSLKRLLKRHRRLVVLVSLLLFASVFLSWLLFGGDRSEPLKERASHNWERLEYGVEDRAKLIEEKMRDVEHRISHDVQARLKLENTRYKRPGSVIGADDNALEIPAQGHEAGEQAE
ncbi:Zinc finger protein-like 1 [Porphyridium purpureum]|uniref:Zinc finger protein-like 1 n=1 Tax=Porphyridium purpureum TaxID=35688 RepID=A0A5J4YYS8_PORPP|nr:Zinc finger protein-like 1 [Porphyridium purpureum]|eukprot:POR5705..scf209_3